MSALYLYDKKWGVATEPTNYVSLSVTEFRKIVKDDDFEPGAQCARKFIIHNRRSGNYL